MQQPRSDCLWVRRRCCNRKSIIHRPRFSIALAEDGDVIHRGGIPEAVKDVARLRKRSDAKSLIKILRCFVRPLCSPGWREVGYQDCLVGPRPTPRSAAVSQEPLRGLLKIFLGELFNPTECALKQTDQSRKTSIQIFPLRRFPMLDSAVHDHTSGYDPHRRTAVSLVMAGPPDSKVDNAPFCHT